MATRKRKLDVEIGSEFKGDGFREADRAADRLGRKLRKTSRRSGEDSGDEFGKGFESKLGSKLKSIGSKITGNLDKIGAVAGGAFAASFAGQAVAGLGAGIQSALAGAGAGLALLPAAALAGGLALGSLKVALSGVGDVLSAGLTGDTEAFAEGLKGLAPPAREFARETVGLRDGIDKLRTSVQGAFFEPLVGAVRPLGERYLPMVGSALADVAAGFGAAVADTARFLALPEVAGKLGMSLGHARTAATNFTSALAGLPAALLPLVTVGSTFLPQLTGGLSGATDRLALFMARAEQTGQLRDFIQGGIDAVKGMIESGRTLAGIFGDLGAIGSAVFGASGLGGSAGGLLDSIAGLTGQAREFIESAKGAEVLGTIFEIIGEAVANIRQPIERAFGILVDVIGPLLPDLRDLWSAFSDLKNVVLNIGLDVLEPALHGVGTALGVVLPLVTGLANFLANNQPLVQGIAIAIGTLLVPAFIAWAAAAIPAAAATIAATLPIILLGAAIAGLAALVIIHFDTIKNVVVGVFNWIADNWPLLLAILTGPFGLAVLFITRNWETIKNGALAVKDWIVDRFNDVVSFVKGLPGRIADAASGMWDGITGAFKAAINGIIGLWNGLEFPSVTIGGQDPLGRFGPSIPEVTIGGWDLPNIPTLHMGGTFLAPPGQREGLAKLMDGEVVSQPDDIGGDVNVFFDFRGANIADRGQFERDVVAAIKRAGGKGVPITIAGRKL